MKSRPVARLEQQQNLVEDALFLGQLRLPGGGRRRDEGMVGQAGQLAGDLIGREDEIDVACGNGAFRHAGVLGGGDLLGEGDAAFGLDGLEAQDPVGGGARQDHSDGPAALVLGQRAQEVVNGPLHPPGLDPTGQAQHALLQTHGDARGRNVDAVRLHPHAVLHLGDRHPGDLGQDFRQHAVGPGGQVLHQDETHAGVQGQILQKLGKRPPGRRPRRRPRRWGSGPARRLPARRLVAPAPGWPAPATSAFFSPGLPAFLGAALSAGFFTPPSLLLGMTVPVYKRLLFYIKVA